MCPPGTTDAAAAAFADALTVARSLPKADLHCHLDGSLLPKFVADQAEKRGVLSKNGEKIPTTPTAFREFVDEMKGAMRAKSATDARVITRVESKKNWPIFDWMNRWLQTEAEVREGVRSLAACLHDEERVRYLEIRFCPALHTLEGLSVEQVVQAASRGWQDAVAERATLKGGLILCALRSYPAPHPLETAQLVKAHLEGPAVVGFDVAGSEVYALSTPAIAEALAFCKANDVPVTAHAGELPLGMVPNLETALSYPVDRIGHGLALGLGDIDPETSERLIKECADKKVGVEVCITSICTATRCPAFDSHPLPAFRAAGVRCGLGVDNLTLSGDPLVAGAYPVLSSCAEYEMHCGRSQTALMTRLHCGWEARGDLEDICRRSSRTFRMRTRRARSPTCAPTSGCRGPRSGRFCWTPSNSASRGAPPTARRPRRPSSPTSRRTSTRPSRNTASPSRRASDVVRRSVTGSDVLRRDRGFVCIQYFYDDDHPGSRFFLTRL